MLTLALALFPSTQIVKAEALLTAAVYFTCATIFASMAINLVGSDEQVRRSIANWFYNAVDDVKNAIYEASTNVKVGSALKLRFSAEDWQKITQEIVNYYKINYDSDGVAVTVGENGHIGFTSDSQFSFALSNDSDDSVYIQHVYLNGMTVTFWDKAVNGSSVFDHWAMQPSESDEQAIQQVKNCFNAYSSYTVNISNLALTYYSLIDQFACRGTCTSVNNRFAVTRDRSGFAPFTHYFLDVAGTNLSNFYWKYDKQYSINGTVCYLLRCADNKYRFVTYSSAFGDESNYSYVTLKNYDTNATYDSFDSLEQLWSIAAEAAGLDFPATDYNDVVNGDIYNTPAIPSFGSVPDVYNGTDSVIITVPQDITDVNDISKVLDSDITISTDTVADYPDGVPEIDSSGLFDKFPFCLPVDIYNMITGFYAPAEAPRYVIPIKLFPQNDGYLIDYNLVVDFSFLDPVIPIIRYGTSFIFIVGLILITRKMIGAQ